MRMIAAAALAAALLMGGCVGFDATMLEDFGVDPAEAEAKVEKVEAATLGNFMKSVRFYCKTPRAARELFRDRLNERPEGEGNQVGIWCSGDPPLSLGE